jgi:hypothetical protein
MIGLKARAAALTAILAIMAAAAGTPSIARLMKSAAPLSHEETINRPDCPSDEISSGRFACRITDAGRG